MPGRKALKVVHVSGTAWFLASAGLLFVLALRQAGASWWLIFSLSGSSAILVFLLISFYLFAVYRGVVRSQTEAEHPLSRSVYYGAFYNMGPFLGTMAGAVSTPIGGDLIQYLITVATGAMISTFIIWIIVDPLVSLCEGLTPRARVAHRWRVARGRVERRRRQKQSEELLERIFSQEMENRRRWEMQLAPTAEQLARLVSAAGPDDPAVEKHAVEIGADAWRRGGIACMRILHEQARRRISQLPGGPHIDRIAIWWDGIGTWRRPAITQCFIT